MIANATQDTRHLSIGTPLGKDVLLLTRFEGVESSSELFEYKLEMLSEHDDLDPRDIVGENVTFLVARENGEPRYFNGYVSEFSHAGVTDRASKYVATVVPWLWFLSQTADCRIFQQLSTPQIIEKVFRDLGFLDYRLELKADYPPHEYCVQYRESDFNFVSRLMEEEGIFYFHRHENGKHTLVLADHTAAYFDLPEKQVRFAERLQDGEQAERVKSWKRRFGFRSGAVAQRDFNFETPSQNLHADERSIVEFANNKSLEMYDYHGRHKDGERGRALARIRMEEIEADHDVADGEATYLSFTPGGQFAFASHRTAGEVGNEYVLRRVAITASDAGSYITGEEQAELEYRCEFTCVPAGIPMRPRRAAARPIVEGPQTAVVVGPPGEEIYPDEHGRVKVQFHWDREGAYDENSSCWIRVSQQHAGKGWGGIDLPRVGEEVIVDFLEGDPDEPIITGRVYNAEQTPPFALPAEMTRSGMKSQTHKGSGFNEISMDDTAGNEQIRMNAQHNMDTSVGNNAQKVVNVDSSTDIGNNDSTKVGNNASESVGNNKEIKVGNNMTIDVGSKLNITAGSSITIKCGASKIYMNSGGIISITGTIISTAAAANASVVAPMTQVVGGVMCSTVGAVNMVNGAVCHVGAAGLASVAGAKVDLAATGMTSIKGGTITLN